MFELVGRTLGKYTLLSMIGRGGMASVFKAQDQTNEQIVALKILAPQLAMEPRFRERFKREAEVLSQLDHPSIMPLLDWGEAKGLFYIVMPFMQVGCLSEHMESGPLDVQEGARIFEQIAAALQYAHGAGVVHRDVKPSNIMLDKDGNAWLSDFGFAHVGDASMSLTGSAVIGTPAYIAPEVVLGNDSTPLSDQYSLGVVLYQMSTGYLPYDAETPMAVAVKQAAEPLPRPRWVNPNLPDAVEEVILRVLSKDPEKRYPSVTALSEAFHSALHKAIDFESGVIKPGARGQDVSTEHYEPIEVEGSGEGGEEFGKEGRKRRILALVLLSLLALPLTCWAGARLGSGFFSLAHQVTEVAAAGSQEDLAATLTALSTELAPREGTVMATGEVETMVAQTVTAMAVAGEGLVLASVTPTGTLEGEALLSGTPPDAGFSTATSIGDPPLGTDTPVSSTATSAPGPSNTPPPTNTLPPGVTPSTTQVPTETYTPTITHTSTVTLTLTPTWTYTPTQTWTPSPTPTEDICAALTLGGFNVDGDKVIWEVTNNSSQVITITEIYLDWPSAGEKLKKVKFGGKDIWKIGDEDPPTNITSDWNGNLKDRQVNSGKKKELKFEFEADPGPSGYDLEISFDVGCTLESHQ